VVGEGGDTQVDARQVEPFFRAQPAAGLHPAVDLLALDGFDLHLEAAVVDEQDVAGRNRLRQFLEGHRDPLPAVGNFFCGQGEAVADDQLQGFLGQGADADLGAGQMQTTLVLQGRSVGALYIRSLQGFEQVSREAEGSNVLWSIAPTITSDSVPQLTSGGLGM
jgi:hypothetical protein